VRIGKIDGNFVVNPNEEDLLPDAENPTDLDLIVAGTEEAILMVEAGANEIPEAEVLDALDIAHAEIKKLCALQRELAAKVGKEKKVFEAIQVDPQILDAIRASHGSALEDATQVEDKLDRQDATKAGRDGDPRAARDRSPRGCVRRAAEGRQEAPQRGADGLRQAREVDHPRAHRRPQEAPGRPRRERDPRYLDRGRPSRRGTHGSALFTRGQTQALSVVAMGHAQGGDGASSTLGPGDQKVLLAPLQLPRPSRSGEARSHGWRQAPRHRPRRARRERALAPMVPSIEEFPYSIRVVSDILESNGSSSDAASVLRLPRCR